MPNRLFDCVLPIDSCEKNLPDNPIGGLRRKRCSSLLLIEVDSDFQVKPKVDVYWFVLGGWYLDGSLVGNAEGLAPHVICARRAR
jgi:hypothetical protein